MTVEADRLLALLQHVPVGIVQFRRDGAVDHLNATGAAMLLPLAPPAALANLYHVLDPIDPPFRGAVQACSAEFGTVFDGRRVTAHDSRGEERFLTFTVHRLDVDLFMAAFSDVTEVVRNERRVREALTNLQRLLMTVASLKLETHPLRILLTSILKQVLVWIGSESAMLIHCPRDGRVQKVAASGAMAAVEPDATLLEAPDVRRLHGSEALSDHRGRVLIPLNDYAILTDLQVPLDDEKVALLQLFLDTASQAIDNARMLERIANQEKLSAVGEAVGGVVHDLRNPMAVIVGATKLAVAKQHDGEFVSRMLGRVLAASADAMALLDDILDFLRDASVTRSRVEVSELLARVAERELQACAEAGVRLEVGGGESLYAEVDAHKIERLLMNLVRNAVDALKGRPAAEVRLAACAEDGMLVLRVADNGPGIPAQIRDRLFEPFVTHGKTGGTGLGLAIVKQIATSHAGRVEVSSDEKGTCFRVALPRHCD